MDAFDVLSRARAKMEAGDFQSDCGRGEFCPYCATAEAKTELDTETMTDWELLDQILTLDGMHPSDMPLHDARNALNAAGGLLDMFNDKEVSMKILLDAARAGAR